MNRTLNTMYGLSTHPGRPRCAAPVAAVLALILSAAVAQASPWHVRLSPYCWATDVGIDAKLDGRQVVDKTIPVSDLVDDIDTIFQMRLEVTHGALGAMVDAFDVTMSDEKKGVPLPQGAGTADLGSDVGLTIVDVAGTYDPRGDHEGIAFLGGARILNDRATVEAMLQPAPGVSVPQTYHGDETLVDALVGVRFSKRFSRHWSTQAQVDVSTGDTDHTWSAGPTLSYAFGYRGRFGISAGYRRMQVDFKDHDGLDNKMTLSGFLVGLRTSF